MNGHRYPVRRSVVRPGERHRPPLTMAMVAGIALTGDLWPSGHVPPIWNQGAEGDCTANGVGRGYETRRRAQGLPPMDPSRPVIYDLERMLEGTPLSEDVGAMVPDGPAVLEASGCCDSGLYPISVPDFTTAPPPDVLAACALHKVTAWARTAMDPAAIVAELAQGLAVPFGFDVYSSFESAAVATTGIVPMPAAGETKLGGHCMCLTGWDVTSPAHSHGPTFLDWFLDRLDGSVPEDGYFLADNSWGPWGLPDPVTGLPSGRCRFPFAMFRRGLAYDPLVITAVAG